MNLIDHYQSAEELKEEIINYLKEAQEFAQTSIEDHSLLDISEKENLGLLIRDCSLINSEQGIHLFSTIENFSKIRTGDSVYLYSESNSQPSIEGEVVDVTNDTISIKSPQTPVLKTVYMIELKEIELYDTFINTLEQQSDENNSGMKFLDQLLGLLPTEPGKFIPLTRLNGFSTEELEPLQAKAIEEVCKRPSLYVIQGPPGTGKTKVLADIAANYSKRGLEVAVIANTHFAVNNALNYIKKQNTDFNVIKIGKEIKTEGLRNDVHKFNRLQDYLKWNRNFRNQPNANIVGMTLQASTINLGLIRSSFKPSILLVDEASQIPLAEGAIMGFYKASTIVLIGDDRQMPPIFQPELEGHPLSSSIFTRAREVSGENVTTLTTTFRMNDEITKYVSEHFYEPFGIKLVSHESCSSSRLDNDPSIEEITTLDQESLDYNLEEVQNAISCINKVINPNLKIAVLTPFRRQVNAIRRAFKEQVETSLQKNCIIDTVERLQGQEADIVIISFCVSDSDYYKEIKSFVENPHRLNVMFSRAKKKVYLLKSNLINL